MFHGGVTVPMLLRCGCRLHCGTCGLRKPMQLCLLIQALIHLLGCCSTKPIDMEHSNERMFLAGYERALKVHRLLEYSQEVLWAESLT